MEFSIFEIYGILWSTLLVSLEVIDPKQAVVNFKYLLNNVF